ncbi:hypothetical protein [Hymenobacter metallicola]|uniref:Uncharacterized protein n=1 Tax=Hymenobacter metallicola TaxID=2563114 RepID=A0A4Z0Q009_9BACT|nr:hypothetical protein [Hymenobacter metallicola]TGE22899.1 hypothetical protein E5K02_21285 [Hymenobacter metallicola]
MDLTSPTPGLNQYQRLARQVIAQATISLLIPVLWQLYGTDKPELTLEQLAQLPAGSLGRGIAQVPPLRSTIGFYEAQEV